MKTPAKSLGKGSSALCAMLLKSIDDKDPTVRDAAVHAAGALLHVLDESSLGALMDSPKVDKSKVKKIRDYAAQLNGDTVAPAAAASTKGALKQRQSVNQAPPPKAGPKKKKAPKKKAPPADDDLDLDEDALLDAAIKANAKEKKREPAYKRWIDADGNVKGNTLHSRQAERDRAALLAKLEKKRLVPLATQKGPRRASRNKYMLLCCQVSMDHDSFVPRN